MSLPGNIPYQISFHMCKSKMSINAVPPTRRLSNKSRSSSSLDPSTTTTSTSTSNTFPNSYSISSSRHSLASFRSSLPDNPHLYNISDIRSATNNFLSKSYSTTSSTSSRAWRCNLHGKDVIIFQRKSYNEKLSPLTIKKKLLSICKSHHVAIVNLLGAAISDGSYIYLVYEYVVGASLCDLLRNPNNPDFTVLSSWMSRMQIATDLANGLDYIHNNVGLDVTFVHNHLKSSSIVVTEGSLNAKICHFGTAELCGEPTEERGSGNIDEDGVDEEKRDSPPNKVLAKSSSIKFNGTRGYMSPEFQTTGIGTRKADVYAFGVLLLELLSGEEPVKYRFDKKTKEYTRLSVIDAARTVLDIGNEGSDFEKEGKLRKWVDRRLRDSYPVEVAAKLIKLAVDCVHTDPNQRPDMRRVAGKISKMYLDSRAWCERMNVPTEFTVSFAPR